MPPPTPAGKRWLCRCCNVRGEREFLTELESTYMPVHDIDVLRTTRHDERWYDDLCLVRDVGIRRLRYPAPWSRPAARGC
jgi:hypothetical protein